MKWKLVVVFIPLYCPSIITGYQENCVEELSTSLHFCGGYHSE
jgi:hypothetical protein